MKFYKGRYSRSRREILDQNKTLYFLQNVLAVNKKVL